MRTLAEHLGVDQSDVERSLDRLEANHAVVLHPGTHSIWLVHPFSLTPTLFYVTQGDRGWWAPCIWCALGVCTLVGGDTTITTTLAGETEQITIDTRDDQVGESSLLAHFPIPAARAWENVHRHCACTLVFRLESDIDAWCASHGIARGEIIPLAQVADLAHVWYGDALRDDWTKPTISEARQRFESVGLTSEHWQLPVSEERF